MTTFTIPEIIKQKTTRSAILMLVIGVILIGLGGWLVFGGNIFSVVGGVLGVSMGLFITYASIRTLSTIKGSHPKITIDDAGFMISGEKDPSENKKFFWSEVREAKVIKLTTAPYFQFIKQDGGKVTAGYQFDDFETMVVLVRENLQRFGIALVEEVAEPPKLK
jgi:hypothetical protein